MLHVDEVLLDAIAYQARVAYATTQLATCQAALHLWQYRADQQPSQFSRERIQYELAYYTQQVARWHAYLAGLAQEPQVIHAPIE